MSDNLVKKWTSLPKDDHVALAQYMSALALKMALVSLFGSHAWSDEEILEIRHNYDIVSILSQFFMKSCRIHTKSFGIHTKTVSLGNVKKFAHKT